MLAIGPTIVKHGGAQSDLPFTLSSALMLSSTACRSPERGRQGVRRLNGGMGSLEHEDVRAESRTVAEAITLPIRVDKIHLTTIGERLYSHE